MAERTSRLRQQLRQSGQQMRRQLELFLREEGPLIRGSLGSRARRCGSPGCHCAEGELHVSKYLAATDQGRVRQVHVPAGDEVKVAAGVERYRRFQRGRRAFAQLAQQQLELVDVLGRSLLGPYPEDNPLPAPRKRGRKPKAVNVDSNPALEDRHARR
jgi:hypothetical protein